MEIEARLLGMFSYFVPISFRLSLPFTRVSREPLCGDFGDFTSSKGWELWLHRPHLGLVPLEEMYVNLHLMPYACCKQKYKRQWRSRSLPYLDVTSLIFIHSMYAYGVRSTGLTDYTTWGTGWACEVNMPACLASSPTIFGWLPRQLSICKSGAVEAEADDHQGSVPPITESQHMYGLCIPFVRCLRTSPYPCLGLARFDSRAAFLGWPHRGGVV